MPKGSPMKRVVLTLDGETLDRIEKFRALLAAAQPGISMPLTDAMRVLIHRGLADPAPNGLERYASNPIPAPVMSGVPGYSNPHRRRR